MPAFAVDLSGGKYLGAGGRDYPHMVRKSLKKRNISQIRGGVGGSGQYLGKRLSAHGESKVQLREGIKKIDFFRKKS